MPEIEERLKSPKLQDLTPLITKLDQGIDDGLYPVKADTSTELNENDVVEIVDALKWIRTFLANRQDYHKKRQITMKVEHEQLTEALKAKGVDLSAIRKRAADIVANKIVDESQDD